MTLIPPRGGFGDVCFPSAKEVVLGLPLISTARRPACGVQKTVNPLTSEKLFRLSSTECVGDWFFL